jgi:hypothetical protein
MLTIASDSPTTADSARRQAIFAPTGLTGIENPGFGSNTWSSGRASEGTTIKPPSPHLRAKAAGNTHVESAQWNETRNDMPSPPLRIRGPRSRDNKHDEPEEDMATEKLRVSSANEHFTLDTGEHDPGLPQVRVVDRLLRDNQTPNDILGPQLPLRKSRPSRGNRHDEPEQDGATQKPMASPETERLTKTSKTSTAANSEGPSAATSEVGVEGNGNDSAPHSDLKKSQKSPRGRWRREFEEVLLPRIPREQIDSAQFQNEIYSASAGPFRVVYPAYDTVKHDHGRPQVDLVGRLVQDKPEQDGATQRPMESPAMTHFEPDTLRPPPRTRRRVASPANMHFEPDTWKDIPLEFRLNGNGRIIHSMSYRPNEPVRNMKQDVATALRTTLDDIILVFNQKKLLNDWTVKQLGLQPGDIVAVDFNSKTKSYMSLLVTALTNPKTTQPHKNEWNLRHISAPIQRELVRVAMQLRYVRIHS